MSLLSLLLLLLLQALPATAAPLPRWHPRNFVPQPAGSANPKPALSGQPARSATQPARQPGSGGPDTVGSYDTCDTCEQCVLDPPPQPAALQPPPGGHCRLCYGCSVVLARLPSHDKVLGKARTVFTGASGAAVFRGQTPAHASVYVKYWCGLPGGFRQNSRANPVPPCASRARPCKEKPMVGYDSCNFRFLNAMQRMVEEANLTAVTPRTWTEVTRTFLPWDGAPWQGLKVAASAQLYEPAEGVSIEAFLGGVLTEEALALLGRIDAASVRLAAAFDFVFSESDRHGQNVILHPSGRMVLIDNEGTGQVGVNSMFLPGTQKYEIYRLGYPAVCCANMPGRLEATCPGTVGPSAPEALLDYRCHTPGHAFGRALPPGMAAFVARIASMTAPAIAEAYDMTRPEHAARLKSRVDDIYAFGFEAALQRQLNRQPPGDGETYGHNFRYAVPRPCCSLDACPYRLHRDYTGRLRTRQYGRTVPWVNASYNARVPRKAVMVGGPAGPPFNEGKGAPPGPKPVHRRFVPP